MKTKASLLSLTMLTMCSSSWMCSDPYGPPTYYMDQDFKDHALFPVGSYWIYTTATGELDSVYLYKQQVRIEDSRRKFPFDYEDVDQKLRSSFFREDLLGSGGIVQKEKDTVFYGYTEHYQSSPSTNMHICSQAKPGTTKHFRDGSALKYVAELDSCVIEGTEYKHVRIFENLIFSEERLPRKVYYAKQVGLIRKELFNGQVWNLKRYFINN